MAIEIKGINNLLKKLNKLSKIETREAVEEIADDMEKAIQSYAHKFSDTGYMYISKCEPRVYGNSCYIDVGLKADGGTWEEWKGLYFQNYGFWDYGWRFNGQFHIAYHLMWFNTAIQSAEKECKRKLKAKLKEQIRECWDG